MCELCRQYPCDSRCPYAEPAVAAVCCDCGRDIYEGEDCYIIGDFVICENCISNYKETAKLED